MNKLNELKFAARVLLKRKGYSAVIIATLAIGIGASTAIFTFVNSVLFQPLPFTNPDQLIIIESVRGGVPGRISQREMIDMKENTAVFEDIAGYNPAAQYNLTGQGEPEEIPTTICSNNLFSVLGVSLFKGQSWPEEFDARRAFGIVLTHDLWKRKFDSDASYINGTITLDAYPQYNVFGVLPEGFDFPKGIQMYRSASWFDEQVVDRNFRDRIGVARMRADTDLNTVQSELDRLAKELADKYPETNSAITFSVRPLSDLYVGQIKPYLWLLVLAVGLVLVISCVNVSNLILSAGAERDKEVAIRTVMGAKQTSIARLFLTESLMLSMAGGILGIVSSYLIIDFFKETIQKDLPHWFVVNIDVEVLLFAIAISIATGILAGLIPSVKISEQNISRLIKEGKGSSGGKHRHRLRKALVVAELSLSVILLLSAGLLLKSFDKLKTQSLGFNSNNLLTYRVALPWRKYGGMDDIHPFFRGLLAEIKKIPGVESVALNDNLPLSYEANSENRDSEFSVEGQSFVEQKQNPYVKYQTVNEAYLQMMEIPLVAGRYLTIYDDTLSTPVALINETLAKTLFKNGEALNKRIKFGKPDSPSEYKTIVGIVSDVRHDDLRKGGGYQIYLSCWQRPEPNQFVIIKTNGNPMAVASAATQAVWLVDGDQSIYDLKTMEQRIDEKLWQDKLVSDLIFLFATVAALLAAIGIYSVMSYAVSQRTKEMGVRRVLGAKSSEIVWMIQKEVLLLTVISLVTAAILFVFLSQYLSQFAHETSAWDRDVITLVVLFLFSVSIIAATVPSLRASVINPVKALKNE